MKKLIILIFIFMLTLLSSCDKTPYYLVETEEKTTQVFEYTESDDNPVELNAAVGFDSIKYYDGYIYFLFKNKNAKYSANSYILMRYNPATNNFTYVCADPLCVHESPDCPLFGMNFSFYIYNNKVYFRRAYMYMRRKSDGTPDYLETYVGFCSYDMTSQKPTAYNEIKNAELSDIDYTEYGRSIYTENYRFYYEYVYDENIKKHVFSICRMDLDTGEVIILDSSSNFVDEDNWAAELNTAFLFSLNGRIYFTDSKSIFSTDYSMGDRKQIAQGKFPDRVLTDGNRIIWGIKKKDGMSERLYSMNLDGTDMRDLGIEVKEWELTSNYIYYLTNDQINIGKLKSPSVATDELILTGSKLCRCLTDGSGNEVIWTFEGDLAGRRFLEWEVIGNYVYASFIEWKDSDGDGIFIDSDCYQSFDTQNNVFMRVNISTGDVFYITLPD